MMVELTKEAKDFVFLVGLGMSSFLARPIVNVKTISNLGLD